MFYSFDSLRVIMIRYYQIENKKVKPAIQFTIQDISLCDVIEPNDNDLMEISQKFNIDINDLEDCLDQTERPRFNFDYIRKNNFLLLRIPKSVLYQPDQTPTNPIGIFLTPTDKLILVHSSNNIDLDKYILEINRINIENSWFLLFALIKSIFTRMEQLSENVASHVRELPKQLIGTQKATDIQKPFQLNSCLIYLNTAMMSNNLSVKSFYTRHKQFIDSNINLLELYDDVQTDLDQIYSFTSIYRDLMANNMDAYASLINNNLSVVMKVVGSISLIIMVPTLIASYYGMNVGLPGGVTEGSHVSFYIIILVSIILSLATWKFFRKKHWL